MVTIRLSGLCCVFDDAQCSPSYARDDLRRANLHMEGMNHSAQQQGQALWAYANTCALWVHKNWPGEVVACEKVCMHCLSAMSIFGARVYQHKSLIKTDWAGSTVVRGMKSHLSHVTCKSGVLQDAERACSMSEASCMIGALMCVIHLSSMFG